jgi:hypothetical protein
MNRKPPILQYTRLPAPRLPKPPPKRIFLILGWCLATAPFITFSLLGIVHFLSDIISPTRSYSFGDVQFTVMSQGSMISFVKLFFLMAIGVLSVLVLIRGIKKACREVKELN